MQVPKSDDSGLTIHSKVIGMYVDYLNTRLKSLVADASASQDPDSPRQYMFDNETTVTHLKLLVQHIVNCVYVTDNGSNPSILFSSNNKILNKLASVFKGYSDTSNIRFSIDDDMLPQYLVGATECRSDFILISLIVENSETGHKDILGTILAHSNFKNLPVQQFIC